MKRRLFAMLALCAVADCHAADAALTFRGLPMGAPLAEFRTAQPDFECTGSTCRIAPMSHGMPCGMDRREDVKECITGRMAIEDRRVGFGGARAKSINVSFFDDRMGQISVTLYNNAFATVTAAMTEKFGPPTEEQHPEWKNRAGAVLQNTVYVWRLGDSTATAKRYGYSIDESTVTYVSDAATQAQQQRATESAKAGARSL